MTYYRPTWAEIDLNSLSRNLSLVKRIVGRGVRILVTVKADAYGHGIVFVSKKLIEKGVDFLGVASIDEGIRLREAGIRCSILVLGAILPEQVKPVIKYNLTQTLFDLDVAKKLSENASFHHKRAKVHIKIDTGMGRLGVNYNEAVKLISDISKLKNIEIEGIFTHFPKADIDKDFTNKQISIFERLKKELDELGIAIKYAHAANSMGVIGYKQSYFNLVRPGLIIYGLSPNRNSQLPLKPVISLKSKIVSIKEFPKGQGISYSHTFVTKRESRIAVLPIGYGDGYPRGLSNKAYVLIRNKKAPIVGTVCMDQIMLDVTGIKGAKIQDEVILIGKDRYNEINADDLARLIDTISYEIVCGIGNRIPRVYK